MPSILTSPLNHMQQITFIKLITNPSLYIQLKNQMNEQQKQLFIMCQSNKDYQVWKQKYKNKILQRHITTYFSMISVLKSILTGNKQGLMINNDKNIEKSSQQHFQQKLNYQQSLLNTANIQNPYSHLLCFRLLKDSFLKVDYGLLTLIQAQLSDLIFNVSIFDSTNNDQQRGRNLYLQNISSKSNQNNMSMASQQLQIVGYSVHKIALETLLALGSGLSTVPYHPMQLTKQQIKSDCSGLTQRPLTPRTVNSTFTNEFQRQKIRSLAQQIKNYPINILPSKSITLYKKTKEMNVMYPQKLHYFKSKQIERFRKDIVFNSEQKQYHVLKFYEFLMGCVIRQQVEINRKILDSLQSINNEVMDQKMRQDLIRQSINNYLQVLIKILRSYDRYGIYMSVLYIINGLKIIDYSGGKYRQDRQSKIIMFLSICQILDKLIVDIEMKYDQKQQVKYIDLRYFNMQMFLALQNIISHYLFNSYYYLFDNNNYSQEKNIYQKNNQFNNNQQKNNKFNYKQQKNNKSSNKQQQNRKQLDTKCRRRYLYEYVRNYFYYLLLKTDKIRNQIINLNIKSKIKSFSNTQLIKYIHHNKSNSNNINNSNNIKKINNNINNINKQQVFMKNQIQIIINFYQSNNQLPDNIQNIKVPINQQFNIYNLQSIKNNYNLKLYSIHFTLIQLSNSFIQSFNKLYSLLQSYNIINLITNKYPIPISNDDTSIHQQHTLINNKLLSILKSHQQSINQIKRKQIKTKQISINQITTKKQNKLKHKNSNNIQITVLNLDNIKIQNQIKTIKQIKQKSTNNIYHDDDIPKQLDIRPKSIDTYKLKINHNDISKLSFSQFKHSTPQPQKKNNTTRPYIQTLSFKQSIQKGSNRFNLISRDTQTLRNLSRRKYKRKHSNSRVHIIPSSSQTLDQALSCPTYMQDNSYQQKQFGQGFQQINSQQKIIRKSKQMERIIILKRQIQQSKKQQQKLINMIKKQNQTISQLKFNDHSHTNIKHRITGLPDLKSNQFNIKDSISKQVHKIHLQSQQTNNYQQQTNNQWLENTQQTGITQKRNRLNIKDTDSYDVNISTISPNHRTKNKSRFNQLQQDSLTFSNPKFQFTNDKNLYSGFKQNSSILDRSYGARQQSIADSQQSYLQMFNFPYKIKKDLLKKKVLLIKDQLIQIGMITVFEKIIASDKMLANPIKEEKYQKRFYNFKIKSSLYITPLTKLSKVQLQINCPSWLSYEFQTNKIKNNLKSESQYISYLQFWLQKISENKQMNILPQLCVKVEFNQNQEQNNKNNQLESKLYKFVMPLFINKFFTEDNIDQKELQQLSKKITSVEDQWMQMSPKLIKQPKDLQKYFSKIRYSSNKKLSFTKISFIGQNIYLCFKNILNSKSSQTKDNINFWHFKILNGNQIKSFIPKDPSKIKQHKILENLITTSIFSLLTQ